MFCERGVCLVKLHAVLRSPEIGHFLSAVSGPQANRPLQTFPLQVPPSWCNISLTLIPFFSFHIKYGICLLQLCAQMAEVTFLHINSLRQMSRNKLSH